MNIGHLCLAPPDSDASEHFAALVEALASLGVAQHVLVADVALARRLAGCAGVTAGPVVTTPVMAYCLMPNVDIAHVHEARGGQAGLLLTLTRSIPFVITASKDERRDRNPLQQSVFRRAALSISPFDCRPGPQAARDLLAIYENALSGRRRSA